MIYVDTSVVLAQLLAEDRRPAPDIWEQPLITSRLLEYELWTRLHAKGLAASHGDPARVLLAGFSFLEMTRAVLARALEPFPASVRTLDALHLASASFLRERGYDVAVASFDTRMCEVAQAMALEVYEV